MIFHKYYSFCPSIFFTSTTGVDPYELPRDEAFHFGFHCL